MFDEYLQESMLVSVIVITYNSARYVLETLDSVYRQTYAEIELIISDDCSRDETLSIAQQWVDAHRSRFVNASVIKTPTNGGICHNYNFALNRANGKWIKYIAGDDILENNCIERFVANIKPGTYIYTCVTKHLQNETGETSLYSTRIPDASAKRQARYILKYLYGINGPTLFVERQHLSDLGGFEEKYPMIEDWPIAIRYVTEGFRIGIINEPLVQWRIYGDSISHSNYSFALSLHEAWYDYTMKYCWYYLLPLHKYHHWLNHWIATNGGRGQMQKTLGYLFRCFDFVNAKRKLFPIAKEPYKQVQYS